MPPPGAAGAEGKEMAEHRDTKEDGDIRRWVENARRRLLDLDPRNPLISTRFSSRSAACVRIVDEVPDQLRARIFDEEKSMRFSPLPGGDLESCSEEELKEHAKRRGIRADYELPKPEGDTPEPKRSDNRIQTLLSKGGLARRIGALYKKNREHEQEEGINVLQVAFGFLEWPHPTSNKRTLWSPLVLAPVRFETKAHSHASVQGAGDEPETNPALAALLKERGLHLPSYREEDEKESLEAYWERVLAELTRGELSSFKLHRQVAFGVFPSARMGMWHDLDTQSSRFSITPLLRKLLGSDGEGGGAREGSAPSQAESESADDPKVARKARDLILDADASQFAALMDIASGQNLALEGPPGTGKSQTIANAIAIALAQGKKVLFVAEKAAALEVVEKRLRDAELGEFLLTVHSARASRKKVYDSIRKRVEMEEPRGGKEERDRTRRAQGQIQGKIRRYAKLLASESREGVSVHDLLGRAISTKEHLERISDEARDAAEGLDGHPSEMRELGQEAEDAWNAKRAAEDLWEGVAPSGRGLLRGDDIRRLARAAAKAHEALARARGTATGIAGLIRWLLSRRAAREAGQALAALAEKTGLPSAHFAGKRSASETARLLRAAAADEEGLRLHAAWAEMRARLKKAGALSAAEILLNPEEQSEGLGHLLEALVVHNLLRKLSEEKGRLLSQFRPGDLDALRRKAAEQDKYLLRLAKECLRSNLYGRVEERLQKEMKERLQRKGERKEGEQRESLLGENSVMASKKTGMFLIWHELAKQRGQIPLRELNKRAGKTLVALKPCWMMSPFTVAQHIKRGSVEFDLVIIDEASQMPPENALGAVMRGKQVVVAGDSKQLPPTSFFKKFTSEEEEGEEDVPLQSILDQAKSSFPSSRNLLWHYRSRHSHLIAFSNRTMYEDRLVVFPSSTEANFSDIVAFHKVESTYADGTNEAEAKAMMDAALKFMEEEMLRPEDERRSLGVVVMNQKQRDLMEETWAATVDCDEAAADYEEFWKTARGGLEPFFIKNLENVQGDERDVIFIGITYGPGPDGRVRQNFGPVNQKKAGPRRLNVLLSRAKEKIVTFSSLTARDVEVKKYNGNKEDEQDGRRMLRDWLAYAATGRLPTDGPEGLALDTGRPPDSEFEVEVIRRIEAMGFEAVPQVGSADYFIDIGACHSRWPHGFLLAVECDGAEWHSKLAARRSDRLRQEVLEARGWVFHRIWSTDWFADPGAETERLRVRLEARLEELLRGEGGAAPGGGGPDGAEGEPGGGESEESDGEPGGDDGGA